MDVFYRLLLLLQRFCCGFSFAYSFASLFCLGYLCGMVIYGINGNKILDAILTESAEHEEELGKTNLVRLSWNSDIKITIPAGSYIIPFGDGLKYRLLDSYAPSESDNGFKYNPEFNHPLMLLGRIPFLYATKDADGNDIRQQEWSFDGLTAPALEYACDAINEALGITENKFTYTLCGNVDSAVSFSVSSNDILSVLSSIAQGCKNNACEWHLSWKHNTLYFGQISINLGEEIPTLKAHDNVQVPNISDSKENYYNCFYPQGSTKNMSTKALVGTGNVATLLRLGLNKETYPDGCIYVDTDGNITTKTAFDASNAIKQTLALSFDDIYPHVDLYVYNVRKHVRYLKNSQTKEIELDSRGNKKTYTIWYMRLAFPSTTQIAGKNAINITHDKNESGNIITHYWYDYEIDKAKQVLQGYTLKGIFKVNIHATDGQYDALTQGLVGQPNGQEGFELHYHETNQNIPESASNGDSGVSILKGDYEIIKYQSGDTIIPTNESEGLYPRGKDKPDYTCNMVVLFNIVMGEHEIKLAQAELATRTISEINRRTQDNNNYSFASNAVAFAEHNPSLYIGQKVIFDDGFGYKLKTRVIKLVTKLDYPIVQEITVGNQAVKGTISQLKEDVNNILSGNFSGSGLNSAQIIELIHNYAERNSLSKTHDDSTPYSLDIGKDLTVGGELTAKGIARLLKGLLLGDGSTGIDAEGRAKLLSIIVQSLASPDFEPDTETGFGITKNGERYGLSISDLTVWGRMFVNELEKRKLSYVGGNMVFSACGSKITRVVPIDADGNELVDRTESLTTGGRLIPANGGVLTYRRKAFAKPAKAFTYRGKYMPANGKVLGRVDESVQTAAGWRCYFYQDDGTTATTNLWEAGDQARMQTSNIREGVYEGVRNRRYWRLVKAVGKDYIDLSATDCEAGSDTPQAGDTLVQFGSRTDSGRMSLIYVVVNGEEAPAIIWYDKVNSYTLAGRMTSIVSPRKVYFATQQFRLVNYDGTIVPMVTDCGVWQDGKDYYYYNRVSCDGMLWLCTAPEGMAVRERPSKDSDKWLLQVDRGGEAVTVQVGVKSGSIRNGEGTVTLEAAIYRGAEDITASIPDADISWERHGANGAEDAAWNAAHTGTGKTITVTAAEAAGGADFECIYNN